MRFERTLAIPADHPGLAGHFPGNPIVPGVVILDEVLHALNDWRPEVAAVGMPVVKFLAPLRPDEPFTLRLREAGVGRVRFECVRADGGLVAQGQLAIVNNGQ